MTVHEMNEWLRRHDPAAEVAIGISYVDNDTGKRTHVERRIVGFSPVRDGAGDEHPVIEVAL